MGRVTLMSPFPFQFKYSSATIRSGTPASPVSPGYLNREAEEEAEGKEEFQDQYIPGNDWQE